MMLAFQRGPVEDSKWNSLLGNRHPTQGRLRTTLKTAFHTLPSDQDA